MMRPFQKIAEELKDKIAGEPQWEIPSIGKLAKMWGVSYCTMLKSAHLLADRGIIDCSVGKKITLKKGSGSAPDLTSRIALSSSENFYEKLKEGIVDGTYIAGEPLPKVNFFVLEEHVSIHTVTRALKQLNSEKLIFKRGKKWIVGPTPQRGMLESSTTISPDSPVVVMAVGIERSWYKLSVVDHTASFVNSFTSELLKYGIHSDLFVRTELSEGERFITILSPQEVRQRVRDIGDRYIGAILFTTPSLKPEMQEWITVFSSFKKPVVLFDFTNEFPFLLKKVPSLRKNFYRFHFNESGAIKLAVSVLKEYGHTHVGIPCYARDQVPWMQKRIDKIVSIANETAPEMKIVLSDSLEKETVTDVLNRIPRIKDALKVHADEIFYDKATYYKHDRKEDYATIVRKLVLTSIPLLKDRSCTALIGLSDAFTREIYFLLNMLKVRMPDDISLISFDNAPASQSFSIATVDFGFAQMGYLAAHTLVKDIPVKRDRKGNVPGKCTLVNRGSLGRPRKTRISAL